MKKILIITYYWPPAGGPGVQRWLKFVKYLRKFGIEPVVYAPENPSYPILDKSLEKEVPEGIRIIKKSIIEPYSLAGIFSKKDTESISSGIIDKEEKQSALQKLMLFIRGNFFIPDARKFWIKPSVKFLKAELETGSYDAIITTGPPHSLHLIGLELKKQLGIRWIADFRDPWTQIGYHAKLKLTKNSENKHRELEKQVLNSADQIITTSFSTKKEFQAKTTKPVNVITNGFDIEIHTTTTRNDFFELAHIGSLLSERNPTILWQALIEIGQENSKFLNDLRLRLAGRVSREVLASIKEYGLEKNLVCEGYVEHSRAVQLQRQASVLLLLEIDSRVTSAIIPGKLFEYLAANRPIVAIGPANWDAGIIVNKTSTGKVFTYDEFEKLKTFIRELYEKYNDRVPAVQPKNIEEFHRESLTSELARLIKQA